MMYRNIYKTHWPVKSSIFEWVISASQWIDLEQKADALTVKCCKSEFIEQEVCQIAKEPKSNIFLNRALRTSWLTLTLFFLTVHEYDLYHRVVDLKKMFFNCSRNYQFIFFPTISRPTVVLPVDFDFISIFDSP